MRGNRGTNTKPELIVRRALHRLGYRYRLHATDLPGKPDIVFRRQRCVLQVRGCFWHQHLAAHCSLRSKPRSNVKYWNAKLARNVARDREQDIQLRALGWRVFAIWECETKDEETLRAAITRFAGKSNLRRPRLQNRARKSGRKYSDKRS